MYVTLKSKFNPSGQYFASCLYDDGKAIGIDLGFTHCCITSEGSRYGNPKHYRKHEQKLAKRKNPLPKGERSCQSKKDE